MRAEHAVRILLSCDRKMKRAAKLVLDCMLVVLYH